MVQRASHSIPIQPTYENLPTTSGTLVSPSGVEYLRDGRSCLGHRIRIAAAGAGAAAAPAGLPAATTAAPLMAAASRWRSA